MVNPQLMGYNNENEGTLSRKKEVGIIVRKWK